MRLYLSAFSVIDSWWRSGRRWGCRSSLSDDLDKKTLGLSTVVDSSKSLINGALNGRLVSLSESEKIIRVLVSREEIWSSQISDRSNY